MHPYVLLAIAIAAEVIATISLKSTDGFSKLGPSMLVILGYMISFCCLGFALKAGMPLSIGYAIWSGVGTAVVAVAGVLFFKEHIAGTGFVGIGFIIVGVVMLHLAPASRGEAIAPVVGGQSSGVVDCRSAE